MAAPKSPTENLREGSVVEAPQTPKSKSLIPIKSGIIGDSPSDTKLRREKALEDRSLHIRRKLDIPAIPSHVGRNSMYSTSLKYGSGSPTRSSTSSSIGSMTQPSESVPSASDSDYHPWGTHNVEAKHTANYPALVSPNSSVARQAPAWPLKLSTSDFSQPRPKPSVSVPSGNSHQNFCSKDCPCGGKTNVGHAKPRKTGRLETMLKK